MSFLIHRPPPSMTPKRERRVHLQIWGGGRPSVRFLTETNPKAEDFSWRTQLATWRATTARRPQVSMAISPKCSPTSR
jgi:hypothetical protein